MRQSLPPLNALRAFEAAARNLSFKAAAEELHVTPAAVGQQVKVLEGYLGLALFRRFNRAIELTDAGQECLPEMRQGFDKLASAVDRLRSHKEVGFLVISVAPAFATMWLVPKLLSFQNQYPEIAVRMETTSAVANLARSGVDVAIRFSGDVEQGLRDEVLFHEEIIPVCAPALLAGNVLRDPRDLRDHTLIHLEGESADPSWPDWETWLEAAGASDVDSRRGLRFTQTMAAAQAARDGQGIALLGKICLAEDLAAERLIQPLPLGFRTTYAYRIVSTEAASNLPRVRAFHEWLCSEVAKSLVKAEEPQA